MTWLSSATLREVGGRVPRGILPSPSDAPTDAAASRSSRSSPENKHSPSRLRIDDHWICIGSTDGGHSNML